MIRREFRRAVRMRSGMAETPTYPRSSLFTALAVAAVLGGVSYFHSTDEALAQARAFVEAAPEVVSAVGPVTSTTVLRARYLQGVPGKESASREYTIVVSGRGGSSVAVRVRAYPTNVRGIWDVQVLSLD